MVRGKHLQLVFIIREIMFKYFFFVESLGSSPEYKFIYRVCSSPEKPLNLFPGLGFLGRKGIFKISKYVLESLSKLFK